MWTSRAPASRTSWTIRREVVPRTIESSTSTIDFPSRFFLIGFSLIRTARSRAACVGMMKVRPMYRFFISPSRNGMPEALE